MSSFDPLSRYQAILSILEKAVSHPEDLEKNINEFQKMVYEDGIECSDAEKELLTDLAYDLEYFVADAELRKEDPGYYGEERAVTEITNILAKLKEIQTETYNKTMERDVK